MKQVIKSCFFLVSAVIVAPVTILYFVLCMVFNKDTLLAAMSQLLALLPSKIGVYLRGGFYRFALNDCSPDAVISFMVLLSQTDTDIGAGVYVGPQCNIGRCSIGDNCLLGSGVHIMSGKGQHNFSDLQTPLKDQGGVFTKITIGEDSWIGNGALILANVGKKCVVAAGAVVINDVPDFAIVAGNPAKIIKMRGK